VEAAPPLWRAWRTALMTALRHITCWKWGEVHGMAWLGSVDASGVWQAQIMSGALVGRLGKPSPRQRKPFRTALAMVRASVEGRASKEAAAASLCCGGVWKIWRAAMEPSYVASRALWVAWAAATEIICCTHARKPCPCASFVCASRLTVWTSDQMAAKP
jgi:hypothetical protein